MELSKPLLRSIEPSKFVVYIIGNDVNGKRYVGQTRRGILMRWKEHVKDANGGSVLPFHAALRKHGLAHFRFEDLVVLDESVQSSDLLEAVEIFFIKHLDTTTHKNGYNVTEGGEGAPVPTEIRAKISASLSGANHPCFGKHLSASTCSKIGAFHRGKVVSVETRLKMKAAKEAMGAEGRSAAAQKGKETMGRERRSAAARKGNAKRLAAMRTIWERNRLEDPLRVMEKALIRNHNRWHVNRGLLKPGCRFCEQSALQTQGSVAA